MKKRIVFTGGGSAGHVSVNAALIPVFIRNGWDVVYIGSRKGIEREIIEENFPEIAYYSVPAGKLRRYFSWQNFKDPFMILGGIIHSSRILRRLKPDLIFSKGGFVSVPVVLGGRLLKIPAVIHESDYTPGLANRMSFPFSRAVFTTFEETSSYLRGKKTIHAGAVLRDGVFTGNKEKGLARCGFTDKKPVLAIMGGSLGARSINQAVEQSLPELLKTFQVIHFCGKGNVREDLIQEGYAPFEFVHEGLFDMAASASLVVSRAGSNSIFEFLALQKPMLLIPLSKSQSRGDQIINAASFEKAGYCRTIQEEELTKENFLQTIADLYKNKEAMEENMQTGRHFTRTDEMYRLLTGLL
ncbi:undecaprenyldiphospho-muramoylpentapeptide beta-N-acetylglucosaminyltransferase [Peribacillus sp. SCS-26]|uniref:undecaprenyldiphospho-muramoylpentapeptide beta-N-acetylglucosaminyltransferase n=1 Tax=Paraperibacillus marinus TaxID=3115295 RepID=UPI003905E266